MINAQKWSNKKINKDRVEQKNNKKQINKKNQKNNLNFSQQHVKTQNFAIRDDVLISRLRDDKNRTSFYEREFLDDFDYYSDYYDEELEREKEEKRLAKQKNKLKVIFLGGVGEIGKNMTALEYGDEIVLIDSGSSFPDNETLGVDLLIPDITYLEENISKIKAILLTHGHEDHIGALPYILEKVKAPIYGSKLTLGLVKSKLTDKTYDIPEMICIEEQTINLKSKKLKPKTYSIGENFKVEFVPVCHSIPGSYSIYIETPQIKLLHTGDFKIDFTPIGKVTTDLARFAEIGKSGLDLLMCESTNIVRTGFSMSERTVGDTFEDIFTKHKDKRLFVATFATNISRLQQILTLCEKYNRKVIFTGRSMVNVTEIASSEDIKELNFDKSIIGDIDLINKCKNGELLILCTGSQGEYKSALSRMAVDEYPKITLGSEDTVIISASPIPGNEKSINTTINNLYKKGCEVIYSELADVHVSGHACQEEIKTIHNLLKPKYFIPVHGEYRHLQLHKNLAIKMGMNEENIMICDNGNCVQVTKSGMKKLDDVPSGVLFVDGLGLGSAESNVIKERSILANEGLCLVIVSISKTTCRLLAEPEIITRGLVYKDESNNIIQEAKQMLKEKISPQYYDFYETLKIKGDIKRELQKFFIKTINRRPMILTIILER